MEHDRGRVDDLGRSFKLLESVQGGSDLTVRDDQYEFSWVHDAVKACRKKGLRFRLVDSGVFESAELEWLLEAGADFYTSDDIRKDPVVLESLQGSCRRGKGRMAYFCHADLEGEDFESTGLFDLESLGRSGIFFHISNRIKKRDLSLIWRLSESCRKGESRLVYYHHGPLDPAIVDLARTGPWVHLSSKSIGSDDDELLLREVQQSLKSAGTNLIFHVGEEDRLLFFKELMTAGAQVIFEELQIDYRSPFKELEKLAGKRRLTSSAYYLYPHFLP